MNKKVNEFKIQSAINQSDVDLNKKVYVSTSFPVKSIDRSKIKFYKLSDNEDKRKIPVNFSLLNDTSCIRDYWLKFLIEPATEYYFIADSAALLSIYNQFNDSTCIHFKSQKDDYYGTLKLNLSNVTGHIIVQVIGGRDAVVDEKYTDADGPVLFNFLKPGKYRIKIIYDRNHNNVWDTGNFRNHIQPERVDYYKDVITIRSNWDLTETWKLK